MILNVFLTHLNCYAKYVMKAFTILVPLAFLNMVLGENSYLQNGL